MVDSRTTVHFHQFRHYHFQAFDTEAVALVGNCRILQMPSPFQGCILVEKYRPECDELVTCVTIVLIQ